MVHEAYQLCALGADRKVFLGHFIPCCAYSFFSTTNNTHAHILSRRVKMIFCCFRHHRWSVLVVVSPLYFYLASPRKPNADAVKRTLCGPLFCFWCRCWSVLVVVSSIYFIYSLRESQTLTLSNRSCTGLCVAFGVILGQSSSW